MKRRRRDHDRHRDRLTKDGRGQIALSHSRKNPVVKTQPFPPGGVLAQCDFIERAALKVIANILRKLAPRPPRVISNVKERLRVHRLEAPL